MQNRWCHVMHVMLQAHPYMNMKLVDYDYGMACHGCHNDYDDDAAFSSLFLTRKFVLILMNIHTLHTHALYSQIAV